MSHSPCSGCGPTHDLDRALAIQNSLPAGAVTLAVLTNEHFLVARVSDQVVKYLRPAPRRRGRIDQRRWLPLKARISRRWSDILEPFEYDAAAGVIRQRFVEGTPATGRQCNELGHRLWTEGRNCIHDLSPSNVIATANGLRVIDFDVDLAILRPDVSLAADPDFLAEQSCETTAAA
jgi:hypothetical protein